jgi:hypothetical protein
MSDLEQIHHVITLVTARSAPITLLTSRQIADREIAKLRGETPASAFAFYSYGTKGPWSITPMLA